MEKTQILKYLLHPASLDAGTLESTRELTEQYPWFQTGWMVYLRNLKQIQSPEFDTVLKKVALLVPNRKQLYKFLNDEFRFESIDELQSGIASVYKLGDEKEDKPGDSLIDNFLRTERKGLKRFSQHEKAHETTVDKEIIEKSVSENEELITETLAKLYFDQKKYEKALSAYKKLSLKYPEKSIYFASRIKEIEVIKNNN